MNRKILLIFFWFPATIGLLCINLFLLAGTINTGNPPPKVSGIQTKKITASAGTSQILGSSVVAGDARAFVLHDFLQKNESPMTPYADVIVQEADRNGLDFRLVPAIAMCESNLGKHIPSKDSFNAYGIAVYTGQLSGKKFISWEHSISWVSNYIKETYYDKGIRDLKSIGSVWAPPSVENGYSWTNCVTTFMSKII